MTENWDFQFFRVAEIFGKMSDSSKISRQESNDSLASSSAEDYSSEEENKEELDIDDFTILKTVGEFHNITAEFYQKLFYYWLKDDWSIQIHPSFN